ncbi:MAG: FIST N-terminal domain-containing protein, partial [Mariprofundaceae bacterium]
MEVFEGYSNNTDSEKAVSEAINGWPTDGSWQPEIIFAFHSTNQNSEEVARSLSTKFPNSLIAGCTTAGEWRTGVHQNQSLVLTGISSAKIRWASELVESLDEFNEISASRVYDSLLKKLQISRSDLTPKRHFCIGLIDGMSGLDGAAVAAIANELGNVPFLGGVAGDDFKLEQTFVISN